MHFTISIALLLIMLPAYAAVDGMEIGDAVQANPSGAAMDEVVVTGEWAGPRLWKVTKGEHVLWILGTLQPLPKNMVWQSKEVESVLQESQEVIGSTAIRANVNLFTALPLYLLFRKLEKLPDKKTLQDWLPDDIYQRYARLRQRYAPRDDDLDRLRPLAAAGKLYQHAIAAAGLTVRADVREAVIKLAKKHAVKVRDLTLKVDDPKGALKELDQISRQAGLACFTATITSLETELGAMQARAAAWATGNMDELRRLPYPDERSSCWDALLSVPRVKAVREQAQASWLMAVEQALNVNRSTLAMNPIYDLLGGGGGLAKLRAAGYSVAGP